MLGTRKLFIFRYHSTTLSLCAYHVICCNISDDYCDPLGDYTVFGFNRLLNNSQTLRNKSVILAAARVSFPYGRSSFKTVYFRLYFQGAPNYSEHQIPACREANYNRNFSNSVQTKYSKTPLERALFYPFEWSTSFYGHFRVKLFIGFHVYFMGMKFQL